MATAKKVNKKKNTKAREAFKLGASALINNESAIKLRKSKWYGAVIAAVCSVLVASVPTLVNYSKLSGSDVLSAPSGGLYNALISFSEKLDEKNIDVVFNTETGKLELDSTKWDSEFNNVSGYHVYTHTYTIEQTIMQTEDSLNDSSSIVSVPTTPIVKEVTICDFAVYNLSSLDSASFTDTIFGNSDGYTENGEIAILKGTDAAMNNPYNVTTLFLGKDCYSLIKSPVGRDVSKAAYYREFKYEGNTFNLRNLVKENSRGEAYEVNHSSITEANYETYIKEASAAWATLLDDSWQSTRVTNMWSQTGIWLAIYVGVVLFMGTMLFIITRGKMNPFNDFTWWQTQKIAYWASISPAVLALLLGFWMPRFATLGFLLLFGVRTLWMSFKNLKPQVQ